MRRIASILTVLLASAPAMATVTITAEQDASNPCMVWIGYTSDEAEYIRAFALDITADHNIVEVNDYAVGDDNGGFGIFPGSFAAAPITVNPTTGQVDNWDVAGYSPVAPPGYPGTLGGIGTRGVTIEMGSLYDTHAPGQSSGILCSVTVEENTIGVLCVTANAIRGNVVLESGAEVQDLILPDGDSGSACVPVCGYCECFPSSNPRYDDWVGLGKPECWCGRDCPSGAIPIADLGYQCDGDADHATETFFKYRVFGKDLAEVVANWKKKAGDPTLNACADFDHKSETFFKYRVFGNDLAIVVENWKKKDSHLPGDCPRPE